MTLRELNKRERILAIAIAVVILLVSYGLIRYQPAKANIESLQKQVLATQVRIGKLEIPEESDEVIEDILDQLDEQEADVAALQESAAVIENRLASRDSQQLRVMISSLAMESGIRIRTNESFQASPVTQVAQASRNSNRKTAEQPAQDVVLPATAGWIARMSPGSMYARPLQKLQLEGSYESLRRFLHGLDGLPWQVSVLRMNITKLPVSPLRGMPQPLSVEVILSL
ncbi:MULTISPECIES: hypothetical protein [unclassified Methylophaga]|jgi:type II secretory pathway component PulM|uniref:hypothetical protein n=1 Tax=unclassified Methylophaga TaxID=2629249 RepID=UPI000C8BA5AE|nr:MULTISPECIES: hypothetical protein [unclassified Methylophaga]MAK65785.1 hypothetical protein [Methylophaga sp.]MAY16509.1 hypothetical protein [Methylophaga sp.]HAO25440.1 hypothetical protein [Methylophaga sp.]HCD05668.1 hypothetical protein [Methylophaga sp.]|tara:strand:+ start:27479 stop:28162 length:684 start_codon:yes stop_codon:yes gene_type:complete